MTKETDYMMKTQSQVSNNLLLYRETPTYYTSLGYSNLPLPNMSFIRI